MASGAVGSLLIRIGADTGGLRKGGQRASKTMRGMARNARQTATRMAKLATAATAVGVAVTAHVVRSSVQAARELQNMADVSRATVREFQRNAAAARTVGVEQEKLSDIYKDMNDRVGDFVATGAGPMADFFENIAPKVGVTAAEFQKLSGPDALQLYVRSLERANVSQSEMTFYMEAIAGDSTKLLPLLRNQGAEMDRLGRKAEELGTILSAVEVRQLDKTGTQLERLGDIATSAGNQFAADLAPILSSVADLLEEAAVEAGGIGGLVEEGFGRAVKAAGFVMNAVEGVRRAFLIAGKGVATWALTAVAAAKTVAAGYVSGPIAAINFLIRQLNRVPGLEVGEVEQPQFVQDMQESAAAARRAVGEALSDINNDLQEPLPGDGFIRWADEQRELSRMAAEGFIADRIREREGAAAVGQQMTAEERERAMEQQEIRQQNIESNLQRLREGMRSEREAEIAGHEERMEWLREAREAELVTEQEFRTRKEELENNHQARLTDIERKGLSQREKFEQASMGQRVSMVAGALQQMTDGVASENRKMFELNKASAIANAIISAYQGISTTLGAYPFPLSAVMAAAQAAAAFAQVNAIKSQSFSGGGGAAPSLAGSTPAPPVSDVGAGGQGGGQGGGGGSTIINLEGDTFGRDQVSALIEEINENQRDGGRIILA